MYEWCELIIIIILHEYGKPKADSVSRLSTKMLGNADRTFNSYALRN